MLYFFHNKSCSLLLLLGVAPGSSEYECAFIRALASTKKIFVLVKWPIQYTVLRHGTCGPCSPWCNWWEIGRRLIFYTLTVTRACVRNKEKSQWCPLMMLTKQPLAKQVGLLLQLYSGNDAAWTKDVRRERLRNSSLLWSHEFFVVIQHCCIYFIYSF